MRIIRYTHDKLKHYKYLLLGVALCSALAIGNGHFSSITHAQDDLDEFGAESIVDSNSKILPLSQVEETDDLPEIETVVTEPPETKDSEVGLSSKFVSELAQLKLRPIPATEDIPAGVRVLSIPNGALKSLGLKPQDIVRSVNSYKIRTAQELLESLRQSVEFDNSVIVVERQGQEVVIPVVFGANAASSSDKSNNSETTTILNVTDVDIAALVKTFSKLTKRNYILDSTVKGTVTIHLPTPVTISESLRILDSVLLLKGFTTVPVAENTWKVIGAKDAKQTTIPLVAHNQTQNSDVMVTKMVRLKHIAAGDLQQLLVQFVSANGLINAFEGTNSLIIIDSAQNILRLENLIVELDVPAINQEMSIIPILHANAEDISEKINEILGEEAEEQKALSVASQSSRNLPSSIARSNRTLANKKNSASSNIKARSLGFKIIPDERTNSIIVVADEEMSLRVRALVEQLDSELDRSGGRFYVYRLQHADSEEVGEILNTLINGAESAGGDGSSGTQGSSLSSRRNEKTTRTTQSATNARLTSALQRSRDLLRQRRGDTTEEGRVNLEGEVSIAPDPSTNSLVINASRSDYQKIQDVISLLDIKRRQVMVEATIMEISLSNSEGMGVELQGTAAFTAGGGLAQTNFGGLTNLLTNPAGLTDLTIAAASTGTLTLPGGITIPSQAVLISAVSRLSNVNVLSAPTIMATDNQEAEIIVGQNVPFVTSTSTDTSNINNTFNTIERQDVGITLRITPQITRGDFVVLNIFVEISNVVAGTANDANGPTTTIRTTETAVTVKDGQMVVTGGLIQDSVTDSTRGVPFLQDIPVLGNLFKRQDTVSDKTNLLILITPKVIKDQFDARLATKQGTKPLRQHIENYDLRPSREEIFNSSAIDKVAEVYPTDSAHLPTTITPPTPRKVQFSGVKISAEKDEVVDVSVAPRLPEVSSDALEKRSSLKTKKPQPLAENYNSKQATLRAMRSIAVLRPLINGSPRLLAVDIPSSSEAPEHFEVGSIYKDTAANDSTSHVCIGRYTSLAEAISTHDNLNKSSILRLSPAELVGLGSKVWVPAVGVR